MPSGDRAPASFAVARLRKAEQFLRSATAAQERADWDAAVSDAVLAGIAAVDAYLAGRHGLRNTGAHHEAVQLMRKQGGPAVAQEAERLGRLLSVKSESQYGDKMFGAREARECVTRAARLIVWAKDAMKGAKR